MISPLAVVETDQIGAHVTIYEYAVVRSRVVIGSNVIIHPHVVIESGVTIGDGVEIFPGSYIGKKPSGAGATARPLTYQPRVTIGKDCAIGPHAVIFYDVDIGHNTLLGDGISLREQVKVGHHCVIGRHVTINYNTTIGNNTKIMDMAHITGNCWVGNNVFIGMSACTANDNYLVTREYNEEAAKGPIISDKVTVGVGAVMLPGICIGEGAFIGANSLVSKDVAPYVLVMGVPARVVKQLATIERKGSKDAST
jgi:acetyltransferase-like isoleucine patch superfamily enzyme